MGWRVALQETGEGERMIPVVPKCEDLEKYCLKSLSISQLMSFACAAIIGAKWITVQPQCGDWVVRWATNLCVFCCVCYYYISNCFIEEDLISPLRRLKKWKKFKMSWVEWFVRVFAFVALVMILYFMATTTKKKEDANHLIILLGFLFVCIMYIIWDIIVHFHHDSQDKDIISTEMKKYWKTDASMIFGIACIIGAHLMIKYNVGVERAGVVSGIGFVLSLLGCIIGGLFKVLKEVFVRLTNRLTVR